MILMRKFLLLIILAVSFLFLFLVVFPSPSNAQAESDCRKIFDKEMYQCLKDFNACQDACSEKTKKPDGTLYINSGEIYQECMKASDCHGKSSACNEQALVNFRACGKSGKQTTATEAKKETPVQDKKEPAGDRFRYAFIPEYTFIPIEDIVSLYQFEFGDDGLSDDRSPGFAIKGGGGYTFPTEIKPFVKMEFVYLSGDESAEPLFFAPFEDAKYINSTPGPVRLGYHFGGTTKRAELVLSPFTEVTFHLDQATSMETNITPKIELDSGEIEVKIDNTDPDRKFDVVTEILLGVSAKYTHFWVSHDVNKRQSTVGVYEGEVEVKARDGKTVSIKPDGDKPGVVVVSKKLSATKLALVGLVLAAIVGGIVWLFKKKTPVKSSKKR